METYLALWSMEKTLKLECQGVQSGLLCTGWLLSKSVHLSFNHIKHWMERIQPDTNWNLERNPSTCKAVHLPPFPPHSDLYSNFLACLYCRHLFPKLHLAAEWRGKTGLALRVYIQPLDVGGIGWSQKSGDVFGSLSLFPSVSLGPFLYLSSSLWRTGRNWRKVAPFLSLTTGYPVLWSSILFLAP